MKSNFEERKENRLEAFQRLASSNEKLSFSSWEHSNKLADMIPFGQPILVRHHSEKGHRAHIKKIDNAMRKSVEASRKAEYYAERANAIENSNAISSDDPNCIEKLETKLKGLEATQELMKECNKIIRSKKTDAEKVAELVTIGPMKESTATKLLDTANFGGAGFPSFRITNNGATIRNTKQRIEYLTKLQSIPDSDEIINDVRLIVSQEDNRVQIFFDSIPAEDVRKKLKSSGFHWAPSVGAWMRQISSYAIYSAKEVLNSLSLPQNQ